MASGNVDQDANLDKPKASSEETLSCGDANSFKSIEGKNVSSLDNLDDQCEEKAPLEIPSNNEAKESSTLFRPMARVSAFSVHNPEIASPCPRPVPMQGPSIEAPIPDNGICKLLDRIYNERLVPHQCGHGCCKAQNGNNLVNSLLGPEFVDFLDPPSFPNFELAAIATDISNFAWLKSGLENKTVPNDKAARITPCGSQLQMGHL